MIHHEFTDEQHKIPGGSDGYDKYVLNKSNSLIQFFKALRKEYPSPISEEAHGVLFAKAWDDGGAGNYEKIENFYVKYLNIYLAVLAVDHKQ